MCCSIDVFAASQPSVVRQVVGFLQKSLAKFVWRKSCYSCYLCYILKINKLYGQIFVSFLLHFATFSASCYKIGLFATKNEICSIYFSS